MELLESLVRGGSIPPFVYCYPPRSAYRRLNPSWTVDRIWSEDLDVSLTRDLNIYIHVPFCEYKCGFCNLYTVTTTDGEFFDAYVDALCSEIRRHSDVIRKRSVRTIYIGGGTPSLLSSEHFAKIFDALGDVCCNWRPVVEEVCIEATPDSVVSSPSTIAQLLERGLTRVNMGVQSLDAAELREAGRHKAGVDAIYQATAILKRQGVPNLSTDLIIGFEGQTDESWVRSVRALIDLAPETISTYFLTVRPDAWFSTTGHYVYKRNPALYERYAVARELIVGRGFVQESNVRYKKMGLGGYRQKVLQFRGVPVLGIGAGARTYTNTVDYITGGGHQPRTSQVWDFIHQARAGGARINGGFVYDDVERIRKRLALGLFSIDVAELEPYEYSRHRAHFEPLLEACLSLGLLQAIGDTRYELTPGGYMYRDIISWLTFSEEVTARDRQFYEELHRGNQRALLTMGSDVAVSGLALPRP